MSRIILVVGPGRCGMVSFLGLLAKQPGVSVSLEDTSILPWKRSPGHEVMRDRFARIRQRRSEPILVDVASFYLPYLEDAIGLEADIRIVALKRPREELVASFERFLDEYNTFPTHHWADEPPRGFWHDPFWSRAFPKYAAANRADGIRRYWDEYHHVLSQLEARYPEKLRVFDMQRTLNTEIGQSQALAFAGFQKEAQKLLIGVRAQRNKPTPTRPQASRMFSSGRATWGQGHPLDPARCVVLVPFTGSVLPQCEAGLRELEKRGYQVRRVGGFSAIDQGRNQLATDALLDGFEETMWIDSDIEFHPDSVEKLRSHGLPIAFGIYPKKTFRALTSKPMPGTNKLEFGQKGGLVEFEYAAAGFLLVRREAYLRIQYKLDLPVANERFDSPMIPFFHPIVRRCDDGYWYLAEDYAFCDRARQCGLRIIADTSIRLLHIGPYSYGWEESGNERPRTGSYTLHIT